ncbi:MAG TPA: T9SS type A sorting domain-containing protein, partial [Bacteroidia bacterium]|nr:T9SS type A sorting domain-containing protein [Bacteroidia bacterium]
TDLQCVPNDTNTMYLATGDLDGGDIPSVGLLKSTDNGNTWKVTGLSYTLNQGMEIGNILIDPLNVKTLYVATNTGVMKSTDSAHTWNKVSTWGNNSVADIAMNPSNHSLIYASTFFGVYYYSANGGLTWNQPPSLPSSGQTSREAIGVSPANPAYVYVLAASRADNGFYGFYQSTDSGKTFTARFTMAVDSVNLLSWTKTGKGNQYGYPSVGGQGWYDLPIAVNPKNAQQVIIGGVDMWETNNGGTTWANISFWADSSLKPDYAHADIHRIIYLPDSSGVYAGTDGGIFNKNILGVWSDISSGLAIGQIYKLGASSHTNNLVISGWQDNGTNENNGPGNSWQFVMGSDGSTCLIDWSNDNYQYGSFVGGWIEGSTDGGQSFNTISNSISDYANWVAPFVQDPVNSQTLYAGYVHVWSTSDRGANWTQLPGLPGNSNSIVDLRVATSNNQYIYATTGNDVYVTKNGGANWSNITSGLPVAYDYCNELCVSPANPNKVWAVFSGYDTNRVYYSSNAGITWKSISYGLPQYPVNCIIYQNGTKDGIYVGTDIGGIYYRDSATNAWVSYSAGLPNVRISDFQMNYVSNQIIAATYGRSIWECNFLTPTAVNNITQQKNAGLNVYPNPNNGEFTVKFNADNTAQYTLEVTNVLGQIVYQRNISDASGEFIANLHFTDYCKGVYMVVLKNGLQPQSIKKVIVE